MSVTYQGILLNFNKNIAGIANAVHCHSWLSGNKDCHEFRFSIVRIVINVSIVTSLQDCLVSQLWAHFAGHKSLGSLSSVVKGFIVSWVRARYQGTKVRTDKVTYWAVCGQLKIWFTAHDWLLLGVHEGWNASQDVFSKLDLVQLCETQNVSF